MALPVGPEDLQKLKSFIDFVTTNPTILNFPQLAFVKEFIEKFGGKVPSGEYKMPGGGGCPFGGAGAGGVKTEPKHAEPETDPEPEEAEMESDPESELELDMEVAFAADNERGDSNSPNAVYFQESTDHKKKRKRKEKRRITFKSEKIFKEKQEEPSSEDEAYAMDMEYDSCDESDPIDTAAEVLIKTETDFEENLMEPFNEQSNDPEYNSYVDDDNGSDTIDSDVELSKLKKIKRQKVKPKRNTRSKRSLKSSDDKDFWQSIYKKSKKKQPKTINCTDKCKHKCHTLKISETQRKALCAEYWALKKEERKSYLLCYIESRHISKIRAKKSTRPTRGYTNCYFLKNDDGEKVRVCLSFFQRTFCIPNSAVKMATDNRDVNDLKKSSARKFLTLKEKKDLQERERIVASNPNDAIVFEVTTEGQEDAINETQTQDVLNADGSRSATNVTVQTVRPPHPMKGRKFKKDRLPQPVKCDEQCIMKCTKNFTDLQRTQICQHFWTMDYKRQKDFVLSKIETREVESLTAQEYRTSTRAQRTFSNRYFFKGPNGNNVRVCAKFFMATLCIGRHVINNARKYCDRQTGSYAGEDRRGKRTPGNKIPDALVDDMKQFIESYPTWVPHKNYKTRFLHSSLSIQQMWRDYKKLREGEGRKYCSASFFRHTFHKDFRLAFLKPTSKHAQRVSAMKKDVFSARTEPKKANVNISDYTGEEGGGFWIKPTGEAADHGLGLESLQPAQASDPSPVDQPETLVGDNKHNVLLHIQENVQIHAPQQSMLPQHRMNHTDFYTAINYAQPISGSDHIQGIPNLSIHNFMASRFDDENPAVFRML